MPRPLEGPTAILDLYQIPIRLLVIELTIIIMEYLDAEKQILASATLSSCTGASSQSGYDVYGSWERGIASSKGRVKFHSRRRTCPHVSFFQSNVKNAVLQHIL
jgi:hypothetical protein